MFFYVLVLLRELGKVKHFYIVVFQFPEKKKKTLCQVLKAHHKGAGDI